MGKGRFRRDPIRMALNLLQVDEIECLDFSFASAIADVSPLNAADIQKLGLGLLKNSSVRVLDFSSIGITSAGVVALSSSVINQPVPFSTLILSRNQLGAVAFEALSNALNSNHCTLQHLFLENCGITNECDALCANFHKANSLLTLSLSHNRLHPSCLSSLLSSLVYNSTLQTLDLSANEITGTALEAMSGSISRLQTLETLNLASNRLSERGLVALAEALEQSGEVNSIEVLNLHDNAVQSAKASEKIGHALQTQRRLAQLTLDNNFLSRDSVNFLQHCLERNRSLTALTFHCNDPEVNTASIDRLLLRNKQHQRKWYELLAVVACFKYCRSSPYCESFLMLLPLVMSFLPALQSEYSDTSLPSPSPHRQQEFSSFSSLPHHQMVAFTRSDCFLSVSKCDGPSCRNNLLSSTKSSNTSIRSLVSHNLNSSTSRYSDSSDCTEPENFDFFTALSSPASPSKETRTRRTRHQLEIEYRLFKTRQQRQQQMQEQQRQIRGEQATIRAAAREAQADAKLQEFMGANAAVLDDLMDVYNVSSEHEFKSASCGRALQAPAFPTLSASPISPVARTSKSLTPRTPISPVFAPPASVGAFADAESDIAKSISSSRNTNNQEQRNAVEVSASAANRPLPFSKLMRQSFVTRKTE
mmetsp:Transcript_46979/g.92477  ORF Transcript_46979/g.92477 Transcript_46979/m.92477 type:complete len:647 (+) Transcript_46979:89-2029(+)